MEKLNPGSLHESCRKVSANSDGEAIILFFILPILSEHNRLRKNQVHQHPSHQTKW
jgi:hypothetical protein